MRKSWVVLMAAVLAWLIPAASAYGATTTPSTQLLQLASGQLTVSSIGLGNLQAGVDETIQGTYPSAVWSDTTGSGAGWQGSMAISQAVYTGGWNAGNGDPSLNSDQGGGYIGNIDGVQVVVSTTSSSGTTTSFTWVDNMGHSGSGVDTNGQNYNIEDGLSINFAPNVSYASGDQYSLDAGAQPTDAVQLYTAVGTITPQTGTNSPAPQLINNGVIVQAGGAGSYGTAVPFVSAAQLQGMGSYTVAPGVQVSVDSSAWAATYVAQAEYTIASGPGT